MSHGCRPALGLPEEPVRTLSVLKKCLLALFQHPWRLQVAVAMLAHHHCHRIIESTRFVCDKGRRKVRSEHCTVLSQMQLQRWGLQQGFPVSLYPRPVGMCVLQGEEKWLIQYALYNQYLKSVQILCIIQAIVFVIREMPFHGWVLFSPSSSLSQAWRK